MISVTPESIFYLALFMGVIIAFGFLIVAFIYYSERHPTAAKHKHA